MHPASTRRAISPVFGQLYVSAAVLAFAALFVPLWVFGQVQVSSTVAGPVPDIVTYVDGYPPLSSVEGAPIASYTLWRGAVVHGEAVAVVATVLVLALVVLAVLAAQRGRSVPIVGALLVLGIIAVVLLIADPGTPSSAASGPGSGMLWGAALVVVATSAVQLFRVTQAPET